VIQINLPELLVGTLLLALVASRLPQIWFDGSGRVRSIYGALSWAVAILVITQSLLTIPLNDDEVFYLARSWGVFLGEPTYGDLPLRIFLMLPYHWFGLSPSGTVWLSRISMVIIALVSGGLVRSMLQRLDVPRGAPAVAGAITVVALADLPMVVLRPEYFACLFGMVALSLLVVPAAGSLRPPRLFFAGLAIGLAMTMSIRQAWLGPAAVVVIHVGYPAAARRRMYAWGLAGLFAVAAPTLAYFLTRESLSALWYWNVVFPRLAGWSGQVWVEYPWLVAAAAIGFGQVLRARQASAGLKTVAVFWAFATAANVLVPLSHWYALGVWHASGVVLTVATLMSSATATPGRRQMQIGALLLTLLALPPVLLALRPSIPPRQGIVAFHELMSQQHLLDWLGRTAGPGPVMCVAPYHPIRVPNAWRMTNGWWYLRMENFELNRKVNGDIGDKLVSGVATVIQWNTFSPYGGKVDNMLRHAIATRVIAPERAPEVARRLAERYRLVEWKAPIPRSYGGGRFLVRRDIPVDSLVRELPDSLIHAAAAPVSTLSGPS